MRYNLLQSTSFQTSLGIIFYKRGSRGFKFHYFWKELELLIISSLPLLILGQYIVNSKFDFILSIPKSTVSRICFISFIRALGMTVLLPVRIRWLAIIDYCKLISNFVISFNFSTSVLICADGEVGYNWVNLKVYFCLWYFWGLHFEWCAT